MTAEVVVFGSLPLAQLLGAVIRGNLNQRPQLARHVQGPPGVVRITATDVGTSVTVELREGSVRIYSGATAPADVEICADTDTLSRLSAVPRIGPVPNVFKSAGREIVGKVIRGDLRVHPGIRRRKLLGRLTALLALEMPS